MKRCPYCAEDIKDDAVKCRYCGSYLSAGGLTREWYRVREGKMIAGVCAGLADQFGVSVTAIRLAMVVLALMGAGWGVIIYIVLWVIMPYREPRSDRPAAP
jgi:phage shock protein C